MADKNLSGIEWFRSNQAKYANSKEVGDLNGTFKSGVTEFLKALKEAGAKVTVMSTKRDPVRAFIMHWAWKLANGQIKAAKIPSRSGLNINWDHGDEDESQDAAEEMIGSSGFNMAHIAALNSNHIAGLAIDMTITWSGTLNIKNKQGDEVEISSSPKNGNNRELHEVGASYGVKKLVSDPPHWSFDGH
jgi:hypothetical protein